MSICKGVAGKRGRNPIGIFIHNDAASKNANLDYYKKWLPTHDLTLGFAHYYVTSTGTLQAEDDAYMAWHCGNLEGNNNYLSIEVCQSMGDLATFKKNEEEALKLAANLCKKYGITPTEKTIRLHKEIFATACPHRSVEIHGGDAGAKAYFLSVIKNYMYGDSPSKDTSSSKPTATTSSQKKADVVFTYAVQLENGKILEKVKNLDDFAGIVGQKITNVALKANKGIVKYRVHVLGGQWLPWVKKYDWKDYNNGYAGIGKPIDAIQIQYYPNSGEAQEVIYRVSPLNKSYFPWQRGILTTDNQDGYAGLFGKAIDRLQVTMR